MPISEQDVDVIAGRILAAGDNADSIRPITDDRAFDLADAYRVSAVIARRRQARGERKVGWKIGFTNRTIWDEYGVHAPIWGPMYDTTAAEVDFASATPACSIGGLVEPRIEPEIAFRLATKPHPDMDERELIACIDAVTHGFEVVQSIFPGWQFQAADTVAAFALHGCYRHGPLAPVHPGDHERWIEALASFKVALSCDGVPVDTGVAANVLGGGPLTALRHFVRGLAAYPGGDALEPGDLVTTGTVTRAFPIAAEEEWATELAGLPLHPMRIVFTGC
jgi:2-keto-4-pentenoate hydratase